MNKHFFSGLLVLVLLLVAAPASAASLTSAQISAILGLLQSFGAPQTTINDVNAALLGLPTSGSTSSGTSSTGSSCITITRVLSNGISGSDVVVLQNYLIGQGLLAAGSNTGYFGALTEKALQQWQASKGIVSSGTPATTGYGLTGPTTRAMLACSTVTGSTTGSTGGKTSGPSGGTSTGSTSTGSTSTGTTNSAGPGRGMTTTSSGSTSSGSTSSGTDLTTQLNSLGSTDDLSSWIDAGIYDTPIDQVSF